MPKVKPRLVYLITEDWFFCSHFLDRAIAARDAGYDVIVLTRVGEHSDVIRRHGLGLMPVDFRRRGLNPLREVITIRQIVSAYRELRPDLVHHVALKPILYGTFAAKWSANVKSVVNAPVGMGFVFTSQRILARALRPVVHFFLGWLLNPRGSRVILENRDDLAAFAAAGLARAEDMVLIRGAGVDLKRFHPEPEPDGDPVVTLVARMLWDKGVKEFVEAARILKSRGYSARFVLVGEPDEGNPAAIPVETLQSWVREGIVEWGGARRDIPEVLAGSHIACLPSYREGLPKSLIEALACGRPVVTTDVPGCREVVTDGYNGLLVPVRDASALADAIETLLRSKEMRGLMGVQGRQRAMDEFSIEMVSSQTLDLYWQRLTESGATGVRELHAKS